MHISIKRKLLTIFVTLIFSLTSTILSTCVTFADGVNPEPHFEVPGVKVLANGNLPEKDPAISNVASVTQESVYPGSEYSVKFKLSSAITFTFDTNVDWTEYSTVNIRWRADMPGQILNTLLYKSGSVTFARFIYKSVSFILSPFYD